jgi:hypothetical protein
MDTPYNVTAAAKYLNENGRHLYLVPKNFLDEDDANPIMLSTDGPDHPNFNLFIETGFVYLGKVTI